MEVLGDGGREGWVSIETAIRGRTRRGVVAQRFLREPESDAKEALLQQAAQEWIRFERGAGLEHIAPFHRFVGEMWSAIGLSHDGRDRDQPWSAACISFIVRNAGYSRFRFSASHSRYIHQAITRREAETANVPFWGFRLNEHRPALGDLICQWRIRQMTYDGAAEQEFFTSHCDVVAEVRARSIRTIGGNVGQSVNMKTFRLNSSGFLRPESRLFAILRNER